MSQKANIELVENLKPWIAKIMGEMLDVAIGIPGNNIVINDGIISLAPNVDIENSITLGPDSVLRIWDECAEKYWTLSVDSCSGRPTLCLRPDVTVAGVAWSSVLGILDLSSAGEVGLIAEEEI